MLHDQIIYLLGLSSSSDQSISSYLVICGWTFTVLQFFVTVLKPAPYGRHAENASKYLTFGRLNAKLAWFVQESPAFIIPCLLLAEKWEQTGITEKILLIMFLIHYFQRSFIFPLLIRNGSHAPLLTTGSAFLFCCFNGFLQAHSILYVVQWKRQEYLAKTFLLGSALFLFGLYVNIDSDRRLRNLRNSSQAGSASNYQIPYGGFFKYVSSANYFGEICEWWGFAVAARLNPAALFFAGFTTLFLGVRGIQNHKFYLDKFREEYPKRRKAVIPYLI